MCGLTGDALAGPTHEADQATQIDGGDYASTIPADIGRLTPSQQSQRVTDSKDLNACVNNLAAASSTLPPPVIRGKSLENMMKQALRMSSREAENKDVSEAIKVEVEDTDMQEDAPEDNAQHKISDVSSSRQFKPYHDLSSASEEYIQRRREELLKVRAKHQRSKRTPSISFVTIDDTGEEEQQLQDIGGYDNDTQHQSILPSVLRRSGSSDGTRDMMPSSAAEDRAPIRLSKRQKSLAAKGKLKRRASSMVDSEEDDASVTSKSSRPSSKKNNGIGNRNYADQFPVRLHRMLDEVDPEIVGWRPHGRAFFVMDTKAFVEEVIPEYGFKQSKITSFYRQLNLYGFSRMIKGPDAGSYYHECFLRGKPSLINGMVRVKVKGGGGQRPKPNEIAKTQPDFYKMSPIDDKAKKHVSGSAETAADDENTPHKLKRAKKVKRQPKKIVVSSMKNEPKLKELPPSSREASPFPVVAATASDFIRLAQNIGALARIDAFEDAHVPVDDTMFNSTINSQAIVEYEPPTGFSDFTARPGLNVAPYGQPNQPHQMPYSPIGAEGDRPKEVTPSPVPTRLLDISAHKITLHEKVQPPPIYCEPSSSAPAPPPTLLCHAVSSSFAPYKHDMKLDTYDSNTSSKSASLDMCDKCCKRKYLSVQAIAQDAKEGNEPSDQGDLDAALLIEDCYNIKTLSSLPSKDRPESSPAEALCLPATPVNFRLDSQQTDKDYLTAIENAKDDADFQHMLENFLDGL